MAKLKKRSNECMKCESCGVTQNCSGYECYCFKKTRRGRLIAWQYGMDMNNCLKWLNDYVKHIRCPTWCPKEKGGDINAEGENRRRVRLSDVHERVRQEEADL